jgi:hypothetical protein
MINYNKFINEVYIICKILNIKKPDYQCIFDNLEEKAYLLIIPLECARSPRGPGQVYTV